MFNIYDIMYSKESGVALKEEGNTMDWMVFICGALTGAAATLIVLNIVFGVKKIRDIRNEWYEGR